ncbi:MAG: tetratricopeptide repeat protein [Verrucomicrobiales bacterium]|nr:tetratricopeptide repeat protein [Verrucomicrobiales bacterium]
MATQKNEPEIPQPEAPVPEGPSPIELAVEENKSKLVFVVIGLAVAVCAVFAYFYFQKQKQDEAALAYTDADTVEDYNLVALDHPGTIAAGNAVLRAADLLATDAAYDDALKKIEVFLADFTSHPRFPQGLLAKASISYTKGDLDTAETTFKKITAEFGTSDVASLAHVRIGDIAWDRGNKEEAAQIYQDLARTYPANPYISRTDERIRMVGEPEPAEPSDRQKKLKEEAEAKRKTLETNALEEARKKIEEAKTTLPEGAPSTTIEIPAVTDPIPTIPAIDPTPPAPVTPEINLDPESPEEPAPNSGN